MRTYLVLSLTALTLLTYSPSGFTQDTFGDKVSAKVSKTRKSIKSKFLSLKEKIREARAIRKLLKSQKEETQGVSQSETQDTTKDLPITYSADSNVTPRNACSLRKRIDPSCYNKRTYPVLNVALISYGKSMTLKDLARLEPILKERFKEATGNKVTLNIIAKKLVPYQRIMPTDYKFKSITDKDRLQRVWTVETQKRNVAEEVYEQAIKVLDDNTLNRLDSIATVSSAQFHGLGAAKGRVQVVEYPQEIAWKLDDPKDSRTYYPTDYEIVDKMIHELGHGMFLGHAASFCQKPGMTMRQQAACCEASPNRGDIMSLCRERNVNENFMNRFESCTLGMIDNLIVPAMLKGKAWNVSGRSSCR